MMLAAVLCAAVAAGGWAYHQAKRYKHFAVHEPGRVYRSAWLEGDVFAELVRAHRLRTVVNLCRPGEMGDDRIEDERRAVREAGARLIELPMPLDVDPDDPQVARHVELLRDPGNFPMLVHCQHGVTRTAKFLVLYDVLFRNKSAEESLAAMPLFGRDDHNVHVRAFSRRLQQVKDDSPPRAATGAEHGARRN